MADGSMTVGKLNAILGLDDSQFEMKLTESKKRLIDVAEKVAGIGRQPINTSSLRELGAEMKRLDRMAQDTRKALINAVPGSEKAEAFAAELEEIDRRLKLVRDTADSTRAGFDKFSSTMTRIGTGMTIGVTLPIAMLGRQIVQTGMDFDSLNKGLVAVTGSQAEATKQMSELKEVAKLPGLGLEEAIQGSINLQAAGMSAKLAKDALQGFGNALATVGRGKDDLQGVEIALSQIMSKGKISAEEINQIAERVPQIRKIMQGAFGTADTEVLQKMGISSEEFVTKVTAELLKLPKVTGGIKNDWENMTDSLKTAMLEAWTAIEPIFTKLVAAVTDAAEWFKKLPEPVQASVVAMFALTSACGPSLVVIGQLTSAVITFRAAQLTATGVNIGFTASLVAMVGPLVAVAAAIATAYGWYRTFAMAREAGIAVHDSRDAQAKDKASDKIAADYIKNSKEARKTGGYGDLRAHDQSVLRTGSSPEASASTVSVNPYLTKADTEASEGWRMKLAKERADAIGKLKIDRDEALKGAKGEQEKASIQAYFADQIAKKESEIAEKRKAVAESVKQSEIKAARESMVTRLEIAGNHFTAQRQTALNTYQSEAEALAKLAKAGEDVRERMGASYLKYYRTVQDVNKSQFDAQIESFNKISDEAFRKTREQDEAKKKQTDKENEAAKKTAEYKLGFADKVGYRMNAMLYGEKEAKLKALDEEQRKEAALIEKNFKDKTEKAQMLSLLDATISEQKRQVSDSELDRQRGAMGWVSAASVGMDAVVNAMKNGTGKGSEVQTVTDPEQKSILTAALESLNKIVNASESTVAKIEGVGTLA